MPMDTLADDLSAVLAQADALLARAQTEGSEGAKQIQAQVEEKLAQAKAQLQNLEGEAAEKARAMKQATEAYVQTNPWQSIGIAAAVGFVLGVLVSRR
ncbi:MAG: DUF883 domain-containing protein [Rhodoferax sp.]|nr:MAG: DUF883 domain-containing protein [Rhodoferax sp.]